MLEEEQGPIAVTQFYWYFTKDEIYEIETEDGTTIQVVDLDIKGSSRRFVPQREQSALAYFYTHPDAEGLRSKKVMYHLVKVQLGEFDDTPDEEGVIPEPPKGFFATPEVFDLSEDYPDEFDSLGMSGAYIKTPLKFQAKVVMTPRTVTTDSKVIRKVGIRMMSPEEIEEMSVLKVTNYNILTQTKQPSPVAGGPADGHLGASERQSKCLTCEGSLIGKPHQTCPGHFGHIELEEPVPHVLFAISTQPNDFTDVLNMFCHNCGKVPIDDKDTYNGLLQRAERIHKVDKNPNGLSRIRRLTKQTIRKQGVIKESHIHCPHCKEKSPLVEWNLNSKMFLLEPARKGLGGDRFYPYSTVYMLLQSVSDTDARLMGFDAPEMRPEYMMIQNLPVAPNNIRPMQEDFQTGKPMENDLTVMYANVMRINHFLREAKLGGQDPGMIQTRRVADLFTAVAHCFFNQNQKIGMFEPKMVRTRAGTQKKTIKAGILDNLSGYGSKKTAFRRRINSKVVNNVIRSVISANGGLSINEVGVPKVSCLNTFVREKVTEENIERLRELVIRGFPEKPPAKNGKVVDERYPGAHWIEPFGLQEYNQNLKDRPLWNSREAKGVDGKYTQEGWTAGGLAWLEHKETLPPKPAPSEDPTKDVVKDWEIMVAREREKFAWDHSMNYRREMYAEDGLRPLRVGDIVARSVLPGDYVLFGRQPSLHRQSLNGLRVVPLDQHSISMNPAICVPFNADYDGDQMNIYVPGSVEAMNEIRDQLQLKDNVIHHRMGKLVIGTDHDQTSGVYLLTMKHKSKAGTYNPSVGLGFDEDGVPYFSRSMMNSIFSHVFHDSGEGEYEYILDYGEPDVKGKFYSGYRCISLLLPKGINARFKSGILYNPDGTMVLNEKGKEVKDETIILDGEVITGTLDRTFMGKEKGTLAPAFYYRFGYEEGAKEMHKFLDMLCRLGFAAHHALGYSMGVADCGLSSEQYEEVRSGYEESSAICAQINRDFADRNMQKYVDDENWLPDTQQVIKQQILDNAPYQFRGQLLDQVQSPWEDSVTQAVSDISGSDNAMEIAVRSGGRGKKLNIQQMGAAYGQVRISGVVPTRGLESTMNGIQRQFAHYPLRGYEIEHPIHHGYVKNSYKSGMEPHEYFTICIAGRRSDMESSSGALQDSGYLANKVRRGLESLVVDSHGRTIDLRDGTIVSFKAGGDGFRGYSSKMVHRFPDGQVLNPQGLVEGDNEDFTIELQPFFFDFKCRHDVSLGMDCDECMKGSAHIDFFVEEFNSKWDNERLTNAVVDVLAKREVMKPVVRDMASRLDWWATQNLVEAGEAIGSTAAGCLAEPATQASLRTFHSGGKGQGASVDRLSEVVEAVNKQNAKGNQIFTSVVLQPEYWNDEDAQSIANWATPVTIQEVLEIVDYDPEAMLCIFNVNMRRFREKEIDAGFMMRQVRRGLKAANAPKGEMIAEIQDGDSFVIRVDGDHRDMMNMRDFVSLIQVSGIQQGGPTYVTKDGDAYTLLIDSAHPKVWEALTTLLPDFVQTDTIWCDNPHTVEQFLGLEAALACVEEQLNFQMNGDGVGIGDYDYRYVRTIVDAMGITGKVVGVGPGQGMGPKAKNTFDAMAMEDMKRHLRAGVTMGNNSDMRSVTGSTIAGRVPLVGETMRRYS